MRVKRSLFLPLAVAVVCGTLVSNAWAEDKLSDAAAMPDANGPIWDRDKALGDIYGTRVGLADYGISVDIKLTQYYQVVTSGGRGTGDAYGGTIDYFVNASSEKMGLWDGFTLMTHTTTQFGNSIVSDTGPFTLANTTMLYPEPNYRGTAITGVMGMQMITDHVAVIGGKINSVDLWTMIYPNIGGGTESFMNVNMLAAAVPWFRWLNLSEMGGGLMVLNDKGQIEAGLLVVDTQNVTTTSGFSDMFSNGAGILGLYRFFFELDDKPGNLLFSFGGSTGSYDSLAQSDWSFVPGVGLEGSEKTGTWTGAVYFEQVLWHEMDSPQQNVRLYTGWSISDGNPSFGHYGGLVSVEATGLMFGRKNDRAGIGGFWNKLSDDIGDIANRVSGVNLGDIYGGEVYYNAEINAWLHVTGDLQVVQGGFHNQDPAVILGLRAVMDF